MLLLDQLLPFHRLKKPNGDPVTPRGRAVMSDDVNESLALTNPRDRFHQLLLSCAPVSDAPLTSVWFPGCSERGALSAAAAASEEDSEIQLVFIVSLRLKRLS